MEYIVVPFLIGCFSTLRYAIAAPPLNAPNSLTLFKANLTLPDPRNATLRYAHDFPPEADLPNPDRDSFFYAIPDTDITIAFQEWGHENLPATEARSVLRQVTQDCLTHDGRAPVGRRQQQWEYGSTILEVYPETQYTEENKPLTWGALLGAVTGFQSWMRAYPGLYFGFELFEAVETEEKEIVYTIANGQLTIYA